MLLGLAFEVKASLAMEVTPASILLYAAELNAPLVLPDRR